MNNNQNEAKLKASVEDFIGPVLKHLKLVKEINVSENSQMVTTIDMIRTEVLKIKNRDSELIGLFGKIERQIDSLIDHNEKWDEMKENTIMSILSDILCMLSPEKWHEMKENTMLTKKKKKENTICEKAPDLPLEVTGSSSRSYQGSKLFKDFKDLKELDIHSILCLYSLGTFLEITELERRFVIYWWIGLGLLPHTSWKEAKMRGNKIYSDLMEKGFLESIHNGKQNQVIKQCTINPTVHKWLLSPNASNVIFSFDQSEHSSSPFFGEWFNRRVHINLDKKYLNVVNVPINKELQVVHLGSWRYTEVKADNNANETGPKETMSIDHIEIENPDILKNLSEKTTYLSLRGISGIEEIPESIGKLKNLIILDFRSCYNLIKLPQLPRSTLRKKLSHHTRFKKLMVLDISGCFLLDHMPKWISELCNLEVLKGFLVGRVGKKNESCQLGDLSKLINLKKLSIRTTTDVSPEVFSSFDSLESLLILTITWGEHKIPDYSLPKNLEKLDIRCYPEVDVSKLKNCDELTELKKLYIRGGNLRKIPSHNNWKVEKLRLRFLKNLVSTDWEEVRGLYPNLNYVEYVGCPRPDKFPNDGSCWIKEKADNNQNEAKLKASVEDFIGPLNIQSTGGSIIKKGGFLFDSMQEEEMDPMDITCIVKIIIYHAGRHIHGLTVYFERNDTTQCTYQWGGNPNRKASEVNFETNEYITSVNGHVERDDNNSSICFVRSLVLKTNLRVYGPYGRQSLEDHWKPFEFSAPLGGQIIGFHAYYSETRRVYVNTLGVYVRQSNGTIIKEGPFLGDSGIVKRMDPTCITRIVKIMIYHGDKIHGLTVYFERNGTTQCTSLWGKIEGTLDEINFKTNEYIKSVKGYRSDGILNSLALVTNLDDYGPYGTEQGTSFEHTSLHGQIISFIALAGTNYVIDLGVYIQVPLWGRETGELTKLAARIMKRGPYGSAGGSVKEMDLTGIIRIVKISIYHSEVIDSLTVNFEHNGIKKCTDRWGGDGGNLTEINLKTDEYIKSVEGYFNADYNGHEVVMSLTLKSNLAVYGPYGMEKGQSFELSAGTYNQIIGFHAHCGKYVNAFGVYVQSTGGSIIEEGEFTHANMQEKEMDPMDITRIVKIIIYHGDYIHGFVVYFERNDTTQCTYRWGGHSPLASKSHEVNFKTNEYITSVNGYVERGNDSICFVRSLVLKTNFNRHYGPYGRHLKNNYWKPFNFFAPFGSQIIGFHAYHSSSNESLTTLGVDDRLYVHALGVYVRQSYGTIIKKGPFLGDGGIVKRMDPTCITRIVKIMIYHDDRINGLTVYFERNGTTQCTGLWGTNKGTLDEINFKTNEYIKSVKGYQNSSILRSLVLVTNLDVYGPYGVEEEESFEHTSLHGQIISFFACVGINHVMDLGVHIKVPISKSVLCGGSGGSARDIDDVSAIAKIEEVTIRYDDDTIHALFVLYKLHDSSYKETPLRGGETGKLTKIQFYGDEYIKSVRGYVGYFGDIFTVRSLELITNKTSYGPYRKEEVTYGPYGKEEGTPFELSAFGGSIIGFHGRSEAYLNAIGVYVKWPERWR